MERKTRAAPLRLTLTGFKAEKAVPIRVAYVELVGPYESWGKGLMELVSWLETNGVPMAGSPMGLFYDNPLETPPEKLRSEACVPVKAGLRPGGKFRVRDLSGGMLAVTRHRGPPERYTETYGSFLEGLLKEGYTLKGPAWEVFDKPRQDLRPGMGIAIRQPIGKE